ncbi:MAG: elongation factor G [Planctomycetes bacterium]|nr:elongation factor G [Planctomycetota bacterium]
MAAQKPQDIRNIILLGHGGAGKTTLAEAMLHSAGAINRLGSIEDGSTTMDYDALEKQRRHSIDPGLAHFSHAGKEINLIDAPGYPDFIGGAISGVGGADVAIIVINAATGIEVNTRRMFRLAKDLGLPKAIVINKTQAENVHLADLLAAISETFGLACKPMNLPADGGKKVVDCFINAQGDSNLKSVADAHTELMESVIEADDAMMEAYLGGEAISSESLGNAFGKAMLEGTVIPVLFTDARTEVGVKELLDAVANYFPSPDRLSGMPVRAAEGGQAEQVPIACDVDKPFVAQAFKVTSDPFVGKLCWVRILQGVSTPETAYSLGDARKTAKIGHMFKLLGKESTEVKQAVAGDIIALAKVEEINIGNVLHTENTPMFRDKVPTTVPMYSLAIQPKSRGDEQKVSEVMSRLAEEDPTFVSTRDVQTNETVISGIGDLHLRMMLEKMKARFNLEVTTKQPKIPYRETITAKAEGHYRHKKQTGGAGQFGEVYLRVEPLERGQGYEFVNDIFGGAIPGQFVPAIEKGIRDVLNLGAIAGYQLSDVRVSVYDGKHHPVDSKEVAFRTAGKHAFIDAVQKAKPVLLEPLVNMEIAIPAQYMGDITGDLNGRRGRILGMETLPGGMQVIRAQAPLAEVATYDSQLRSITGGQGSYTMEMSHYEPVPANVQQQIIAAATKQKEQAE